MLPENPSQSPAEIVEALEEKIDKQYPDLPAAEQAAEPAEDADPDAAATEANNVEPPD